MVLKKLDRIERLIEENGIVPSWKNWLKNENSGSREIFDWYTRTLRCRSACPAFHPDASQEIHDFGSSIFTLERKSVDQTLTVLCLFNFTSKEAEFSSMGILDGIFKDGKARDLIGGGRWNGRMIHSAFALIRLSGYLPIESFLLDRRVDSLHLQKDDPRAIHLRKVLRAKTGDEIDLAVKNGPKGKATLCFSECNSVDLKIRWLKPHKPDYYPITLVVE